MILIRLMLILLRMKNKNKVIAIWVYPYLYTKDIRYEREKNFLYLTLIFKWVRVPEEDVIKVNNGNKLSSS